MNNSSVLLIYTGGTIGMMEDPETGSLQPLNFEKVHEYVTELQRIQVKLGIHSFEEPIDSSDVSISTWMKLADIIESNYNDYDGFVVLHGTDTMAYSASALSFMLEDLKKPVIFTGSQLPIGMLRTDGKENLISAIEIAATKENDKPKITEVAVYFGSNLYRGNRTHKYNTAGFDAINSFNYPPLADVGVHVVFRDHRLLKPNGGELKVHREWSNEVALLKIYPGISESFVNGVISTPGLKGLVVESYGSGNAPRASWFLDAMRSAVDKGIHVVTVTQCLKGFVELGKYATSRELVDIGVISGRDMTTEAAITKMMHLFGEGYYGDEFKSEFETSLRGEISSLNE